ncbi:MAG: methyltransferase domain-containing protein [Anaerolineales bacterium]
MEQRTGLPERIRKAVGQFIQTHGSLTAEDLEGLDSFHSGGHIATRDLAGLAEISKGSRLLDIGCGLGGPARRLTSEHAAWVVGVDWSWEMVQSGTALNRHLGFDRRPLFLTARATNLPFAADSFDFIWLQHLLASLEKKKELLEELGRVVTKGGVVALHEVVAVPGRLLDFPLPWAKISSENFLVGEDILLDHFTQAGFRLINRIDWTEKAIAWFKAPRPIAWRHLNLKLILGEEAGQRARNLARGLNEGKAHIIQAVLKRKD